MNSLFYPKMFKGEEESTEGVGLVGTTYTLHTYGHHPPGLQVFLVLAVGLIIPNKSFDLKSDSRGTAQRIASAMGAQNLRKFL